MKQRVVPFLGPALIDNINIVYSSYHPLCPCISQWNRCTTKKRRDGDSLHPLVPTWKIRRKLNKCSAVFFSLLFLIFVRGQPWLRKWDTILCQPIHFILQVHGYLLASWRFLYWNTERFIFSRLLPSESFRPGVANPRHTTCHLRYR